MRQLALLLSLGNLVCSFGQSYFGPGATWVYVYSQPSSYWGEYVFTYAGQIQVNGKSYEQLNQVTLWNLNTGPTTILSGVSGPVPVHFFRVANDSVYYLINNREFLMYPVNAQLGDSWVFGPIDSLSECLGVPTATVVAVGADTINGKV